MIRFSLILLATARIVVALACVNDERGGQFLPRCPPTVTTTTSTTSTATAQVAMPMCETCICGISSTANESPSYENEYQIQYRTATDGSMNGCICQCNWSRGIVIAETSTTTAPVTTTTTSMFDWVNFFTVPPTTTTTTTMAPTTTAMPTTTTTTTTTTTEAVTTTTVAFVTQEPPAYNVGSLDPRTSCLYWGASMTGGNDPFAVTPGMYDAAMGEFGPAAIVNVFVGLPITNNWLVYFAPSVNPQTDLMITLEPRAGLQDAVNNVQSTASLICSWASALPATSHLLIRFAHEMNGNWYPWGQKPVEYVNAYRMMSKAVRSQPGCRVVRFVWAPNIGTGYPFGGAAASQQQLDTNHDGMLTPVDDAYDPFFPGADFVDVVGLSLYWKRQGMPPAGFFAESLNYQNFYQRYIVQLGKPLMIAETSADTMEPGVKKAWLQQLLDPDTLDIFRGLRYIVWFEVKKDEGDFRVAIPDGGLVLREALERVQTCLCKGSFWVGA